MGDARALGRYEVVRHLASGGMAQVLLARARGIENFERYVVIKQIHVERARDENVVKMFLDEARLAATLHHTNIVQVHDIGQEAGEYFFAMEYVHGEDLRTLLTRASKKHQQLPLEHIVSIASGAAAGLHHAHEQCGPDRKPLQLVHRDVSPANILVGYDGNVKVVDFGIAKAAHRSVETHSGTLKGKISYMSPEQCMGQEVDRRSDVFSLGIVLFELTTVRRLFKAPSDYLTMGAIVAGNVPRPSLYRDIPEQLENIIVKALALDPVDRFQTAAEMRIALDKFAASANLRTSTTALADYMVETFGNKKEPWLVDEDELELSISSVDFDGSVPGAAEIDSSPGIPVTPVPGSPLARARRATGPQKHRIRPATPAPGWDADDEKPTTASGTPMAWTPSALPIAPKRSRKGVYVGFAFAVVAAGGVGTWLGWPSGETKPIVRPAAQPTKDTTPTAEPATKDSTSKDQPAAEPVLKNDPGPDPTAAPKDPIAEPAVKEAPKDPVAEPDAAKPAVKEPPKDAAAKKPVAKPIAKATKPITKPAAKPTTPAATDPDYDPDQLFLKKPK